MALNITNYFEVMQRRDFLRNHQYRVTRLFYEGIALSEDDRVYLKTGEVPNRTINSVPVPFMGLNFSVPGTAQYAGTIALTFYCDQPQIIRDAFERMSFATFDNRTSGGAYTVNAANSLTFVTYNNLSPETVTTQYNLVGIYPTEVGALTMDTTGNGDALSFQATLAYQYWEKVLPGVTPPVGGIGTFNLPSA